MKSQDLKKLNLPDNPGVYFFKKGKTILYIGKATSLRDRVRSYFSKDLITMRGPAILDMVTLATTVTVQITETVLEAVILEANLIKQHSPKYNVKEKDNKSFAYMVITDEDFPRIGVIRGRTLQVQKSMQTLPVRIRTTFGPFPSAGQLQTGLQILRRVFPFRDLKSVNPTHDRFYQQLALSPDHTTADAQKKYKETIGYITQFFKGNKKGIIATLEKQMHHHAKRMEFEQADQIKKKLFALQHINDVALMRRDFYNDIPADTYRIESYDIAHLSGHQTVGVMVAVENGRADKSGYRKFKIRKIVDGKINDLESTGELLRRRFAHHEWVLPNMIAIDGGETHYRFAQKILRELGIGKQIQLVAVVKDARHKARAIIGDETIIKQHKQSILLANSESHRFAINYHKQLRTKNFLK